MKSSKGPKILHFFNGKETFYFENSHLFILSFMSFALGDILVKILLSGLSEIFLPMFSSNFCLHYYFYKQDNS